MNLFLEIVTNAWKNRVKSPYLFTNSRLTVAGFLRWNEPKILFSFPSRTFIWIGVHSPSRWAGTTLKLDTNESQAFYFINEREFPFFVYHFFFFRWKIYWCRTIGGEVKGENCKQVEQK